MFDESSNPQPTDPPTGGTGGGGGNIATDVEEPQLDEAPATDPPTGTSGGGS